LELVPPLDEGVDARQLGGSPRGSAAVGLGRGAVGEFDVAERVVAEEAVETEVGSVDELGDVQTASPVHCVDVRDAVGGGAQYGGGEEIDRCLDLPLDPLDEPGFGGRASVGAQGGASVDAAATGLAHPCLSVDGLGAHGADEGGQLSDAEPIEQRKEPDQSCLGADQAVARALKPGLEGEAEQTAAAGLQEQPEGEGSSPLDELRGERR
jgi:hypothetical protein